MTIPVGQVQYPIDPDAVGRAGLNQTPNMRAAANIPTGAATEAPAAAEGAQPAAGGLRRALATAKSYFGSGGSATANTAESAGADAAAAGSGGRILGGLRSVGGLASRVSGLGTAAYGGYQVGTEMYKRMPQESAPAAPGTPGWGGEGSGGTPDPLSASNYSDRMGTNPFGGDMQSQDGIGRAVNAGIRGVGGALGQDWGADPAAKDTVDANRAAGNDPFGAPMAPPNPGAARAAPADIGLAAGNHNGQPGGTAPAGMAPVDSMNDGKVHRDGSSFSGGNITAGNVNTIPGGPTASNSDVLAAAKAADQYGPGGHTADGTPGGAVSMGGESEHNKNFAAGEAQYQIKDALAHGGLRGPAQAQAIADGYAKTNPGNDQATLEGLRQQGETMRAIASNKLQQSIHTAANTVATRGQDMELQGKQIPLQVAQAMRQRMAGYLGQGGDGTVRGGGPGASAGGSPDQLPLAALQTALSRAQANGDSMAADELGKQVSARQASMATQQQANDEAQKATQSRLENTFRTKDAKGNDVPDHESIASYNSALGTTLPKMIENLKAAGTPAAQAKAQDLATRGPAALDPADHDHMMHNFQTREALRGMRSHMPGGAEFIDSPNLLDYDQKGGDAGISRQPVTPNRIEFKNGSSATRDDLSIRGGANAFLPDWGKERTTELTRGLRTQ